MPRQVDVLEAVTTANQQSANPDQIIGLAYETQRVLVGKDDLRKLFEINSDRRDIRASQVDKLFAVLTQNKNFAGVFLVNRVTRNGVSKMRMIDCNHRYEALLEFFARYPDMKVMLELHIFSNLTPEQEREEFYKSNNHINQTTSDYVQLYRDELNIWKVINDDADFPVGVSHKTSSKKYALHTLLFPYLTRDAVPYRGGYDGSPMDFINALRSWNLRKNMLNAEGEEAYRVIKAFLKDFKSIFGDFTKKNAYWRPPVFFPVFRIWWENKANNSYEEVLNRLRKLTRPEGKERVMYWAGMGAPRGNCEKSVIDFLTVINKGNSRRLFHITSKYKDNPETGEEGAVYKEYGRA